MAILVPSILTKDAEELKEKVKFLESFDELQVVQLDFADGKFVPNELVYPKEVEVFATRLALEAHLMMVSPQHYFHDLEILGIKTVFVHYESFRHVDEVKVALKNAREMGFRPGLALNPNTDIKVFDWFVQEIEEALLLGVNPGFQGAKFIPQTLERLQALRKRHEKLIIEVDGGVKLGNLESLVAHGADKVNVGSGIWQTPNPQKTIEDFLAKLK